jgi:hypothetical protein
MVGLTCGVANGLVAAVVAVIFHQPLMLAVVICVAMIGNLFVPLCRGLDPAGAGAVQDRPGRSHPRSSSPTFTDTCGFALMLGLGGWLLM